MVFKIQKNNQYKELYLKIGDSWESAKCNKNKFLISLFDRVDDGDGIIQNKEICLLRKLLVIADNLLKNNNSNLTNDKQYNEAHVNNNFIEEYELELLLKQLNEQKINIENLKKEVENENNFNNKYPDAVDITSKFQFKSASVYNIQIYKTCSSNSSTSTSKEDISLVSYEEYIIKFTNHETNQEQHLKIHIDKDFNEKQIQNLIQSLLEESNTTIIDLMCNEINDLYICSNKNNNKKYGGNRNDGYEKLTQDVKGAGFYNSKNEQIVLYSKGDKIDIDVLTHELGHAKDSGSYNSRYLFQLLSSEKAGLNDRYFLVSPEEFYAEFFKDYAIVQAHIEKQLNKNYGEILNKMPESHRQKFIQEVAIMKITGENETVSSILERAGLEQYKNLFNEDIDKKIDASLPNSGNNYELISHLSLIYKCSKKNSEIRKEFNKFIRDISNEYNSPKKAKKLMGV